MLTVHSYGCASRRKLGPLATLIQHCPNFTEKKNRPEGRFFIACYLLRAYFGKVARCGETVLPKLLPLLASQLVDQVIAPRSVGYFATGI